MHFNHNQFNYWPIYDHIRRLYPIGIPKDGYEMYRYDPGLKELESRVVEAVHNDESAFWQRWRQVEAALAQQTRKEVVGTTYGQAPSFSAYVVLDAVPSGNLTRYKDVFLAVSLVGPFYTVVGRDRVEISEEGPGFSDKRYYGATALLTVSPENEYAEVFQFACAQIEQQFEGYRFVPHSLYSQTLAGLQVPYSDAKREALFHALFNDQIDLNAATFGDEYYKCNNWLNEGADPNPDNSWVVGPPRGF